MSITTSQENGIEIIKCEYADEFLDYLQLRNPRWLPPTAMSSPWVFRGQRKIEWSLTPKALRGRENNIWFEAFELYKTQNRDALESILKQGDFRFSGNEMPSHFNLLSELIMQVATEWFYVAEFLNLADEVGFVIPEDKTFDDLSKYSLRAATELVLHKDQPLTPRYYRFDPIQVEFALAQHHGIPTRLLDWTNMSQSAAFFAAEDVIKTEEVHDYNFAVWAINLEKLTQSDIHVVRHKRGKISYLHAQGGLFIYDTKANIYFLSHGEWRSFEKAIADGVDSNDREFMRKVTLPAHQAKEVIRLLAAESITRTHLMPTYDNITETLKMRQLMEKLHHELRK